MNLLRTFIAIELSESIKDHLLDLQEQLRAQLSPRSVRWVAPEGIHLTLKFLGDTPAEQISAVCDALARAAGESRPFTCTVRGMGCFPNSRRPRVVWVGLEEATGHLAALQKAVEAQVAPLGFPTENHPFQPHLTLGRVQRYASPSEVREIGQVVAAGLVGAVAEMRVTRVSLIKSDLRPSGAVYTTLSSPKLGGE